MDREQLYLPLAEAISPYLSKPEHLDFIRGAFDYAYDKHNGQYRKSGDPYITHPVQVAVTLAEYRVDPNTITAGLLHDILEDTSGTYEELKSKFGDEVADIVDGVTKLHLLQYEGTSNKVTEQAKNHQKMVLAMARDIRVIFVKLSDRLNNMRTLSYLDHERQIRISRETLDIYAPIAHRLGMYRLKAELEDLAFKYLYPNEYLEIARLIKDKKGTREADIKTMEVELEELLKSEDFHFEISGRIKNIQSVYRKMQLKHLDFEEISDLLALRVIVDTVSDCYRAIGIIHSKFIPVPGKFKDYIAMPKPNMYQSLHTTVVNKGKIYEIQIRTREMDKVAEKGVAAHWAYKESQSGSHSRKNIEDIVSSKLRWYSELIKYTEESASDEEILDIFTDDILNANVYVFTPKGDIIDLPAGATPIDFAFRIHTKIGEKMVGAIVNGKIQSLDYTLKTGDMVEVKTSQNAVGPNNNWLKMAKSQNARSKIKNFLNRQKREYLVETGKQEFEQELQSRKVQIDITDKLCRDLFGNKGVKSEEDLYYEIGKNVISPVGAVNLMTGKETISEEELIEKINTPDERRQQKTRTLHNDINIIVEGLTNPSVRLANCCNPILGDNIVGYVSKNSGIIVHRDVCNNLDYYDKARLIEVYWGSNVTKRYETSLKIIVQNRDNILAEIINVATSSKAKINQVSAQTNKASEGIIRMKLEIGNVVELDQVVANIQKIRGIFSIERIC
ncbi:MAG TPA: bifunctional (p)ppGpp synthetase/guanosine-3',5'-bis(diphosphate) 3'-pyrophosphohydrolase [Candidatus Izemoplasmatales bacterium]|nr:bifunctional (p)ppGpp synthetase/guanosine-3',5'-bis(diphosphate) 3'-pyrophosphohydrolase [Candidatus Izemoplasmatales bacterium]